LVSLSIQIEKWGEKGKKKKGESRYPNPTIPSISAPPFVKRGDIGREKGGERRDGVVR